MSARLGKVEERGAALARDEVERRLIAVAADFVAAAPGARVERQGDAVSVTGVDLLRRWLDDARLRFAGRGR